jgi:hypothetical protein
MARLSGDASNPIVPNAEQIFKDLQDWNRILADTSLSPPSP